MSNPVILREDFFRRTDLTGLTVTDPVSATGFPATRFRDDKDYVFWKPATAGGTRTYKVDLGVGNDLEANAVTVINHNMFSQSVTWRCQYSDDDVAWTGVLGGTVSPTADTIQFRTFDGAGAHRYWRVEFIGVTTSLTVGEVLLGRRIEFPYGIQFNGFDPIAEQPQNRARRSEQGHIVRVTSDFSERRANWNFRLVPYSFVNSTTTWTGFRWWWDNYGSTGFPSAFAWNPGNPGSFEDDALWGIVDGTVNRPIATQVDVGMRDVSFSIMGLKD